MDKNKIREALETTRKIICAECGLMQSGLCIHDDSICHDIQKVDVALAELDKDDWIKVTPETMPEDNELVIIFSKHGREMVVYNGHNNCWDDMDGDDYYRDIEWASHWQPLPSNPKE